MREYLRGLVAMDTDSRHMCSVRIQQLSTCLCQDFCVRTVVAALPAYACMLTFPKEVSQGECRSWLPSRLQVHRPLSYQCMLTDCTLDGPNLMTRGGTLLEVVRRMHVITACLDFFYMIELIASLLSIEGRM